MTRASKGELRNGRAKTIYPQEKGTAYELHSSAPSTDVVTLAQIYKVFLGLCFANLKYC